MERFAVEIEKLRKIFFIGFFRKRIDAVSDVSFAVREGEIFGLLGPNGAGKTTTIKLIMSLIKPTSGKIRIFGEDIPSKSVYRMVGFLPENPYFYDYLTPLEFMDFQGALYGMGKKERIKKTWELLELLGIAREARLPLRKFSKGMIQRLGLAQALIGDPKLLVLDEPMSGLDPIGRREIRDLLLSLKDKGMTILFSSHILTDVEMICDRVGIMDKGRVKIEGELDELLRQEVMRTTIEAENVEKETYEKLVSMSYCHRIVGGKRYQFEFEGEEGKNEAINELIKTGGKIISVIPHRETLENIFVRNAIKRNGSN